jgi:hypothetical protein
MISASLGLVALVLGLWLLALGEFSSALVPGVVCTLLGTLYLLRPYFTVNTDAIVIPAPLGPVRRVFEYTTLEIDGSRLIAVSSDGTRKKLPVYRAMSHPADWKSVVATTT